MAFFIETLKFDFVEETTLAINNDDLFETRDPTKMHKWSIHLYPRGRDERYKEYISIFLKHLSGPSVQAVVELRIEGNKNQIIMVIPQQLFTRGRRWGVGEYLKIENFNEKLGNNVKISCRIKLIYFRTKLIESVSLIDYSNRNALRFLKKLFIDYKNQSYCDIRLFSEIDKCYFQLHKIVLFASSEKFELANKIIDKDSNNNPVDVDDDDDLPIVSIMGSRECLQKFIKFLYKHELDRAYKLKDLMDLLQLAVNYEIRFLNNECQNILIRSYIDNDSLFVLLKLDEKYLVGELKKAIFNYIKRYYSQLSELQAWKELIIKNPKLYKDLLTEILAE